MPQRPTIPHPFSGTLQRILRQTEVMLQRRLHPGAAEAGLDLEPAETRLPGLEVTESTWAEWTEAVDRQHRR